MILACLYWFYHRLVAQSGRSIGPVIAIFMLSTMVISSFNWITRNGFLDGVLSIYNIVGSMLAFWVAAMVLILIASLNKNDYKANIKDVGITASLLIIPILIITFWLVQSPNFKIGG